MRNASEASRFFTQSYIVRFFSKEDIESKLEITLSDVDWDNLKDKFNNDLFESKLQLNKDEVCETLASVRSELAIG
jgi:hypothetical protein